MRLHVNGTPQEAEATSLADLLDELGYAGAVVATAVNGEFVAAGERAETILDEGDRIEILAPMKGG